MSRFGASPRTPALRSGCSGAMLFGGRKESFPQLRSPPRSGLLEYSVLYRFSLNVGLFGFVSVPSESALAQPPSSFSYPSISQDFRLFLAYYVGAHPLVMDALAEMSEAQIRIAHLTHPPVRVCAKPRSQGREGCEWGSLNF